MTIKDKTNVVISTVLTDKEIHRKLVDRFEKELVYLPEGILCQKSVNGKIYLYHYLKKNDPNNTIKQRCLSKKDDDFTSAIKRRHFIQKSLPYLHSNIKAIDTFLKQYVPYDAAFIETKLPKSYNSISQKCYHDSSEKLSVSSWLDDPYKINESFPEGLINSTANGRKVRSKSEAIIAGLLEVNNIPFRYEAELIIKEHHYYPDFTILKPRDGEIIYWEHFGMTSNADYSLAMEQKMVLYVRHGIIPWNKLITTYDSKNGSIDAQTIQNIIKAFIV